ncbi:AMP-binding protein [Pseudonocardia adelaidensis]|uniref:Long-chain-fatty-acid--CoA ligase n=1 Tax=Pseudonocardia adelaidensis TaxID=648754 RepID=A0ABP9NFP6_9PSEU
MTLGDLLADLVDERPDAVLVIDGEDDVRVTRGEFLARTAALRDVLRERGVGEGDCVGVMLPNWSDALVWQFAAAALGAHVIGINTRYGTGDIAHVLEKARPAVVAVAHDFLGIDLAGRLRAALPEAGVPAPEVAVVAGPGRPPVDAAAAARHDVGAGAWVPPEPTGPVPDPATLRGGPDALAVAFTTSGSTGRPKLAAHLGSGVATHARAVAAAGGWDESCVSLVVLPLSGVFGYVPAIAAIAAGGAVLLEPRFDPAQVLRHMTRHRVTHLACADDISGRLMDAWRAQPVDLSSWRRLLLADFYGSSAAVAAWAEDETATPAYGVYGSSELFALISFWHPADPRPQRWRGGGRPVSDGIEVRAVDLFTGESLTGDEPGELQFRGYNVVDGYLGDHDGETRAAAFTEDGWFRSGDLGTAHPDGSFGYLNRIGDSLRLKGFLVDPAEIENRLAEHPDVGRTKVVGITVSGETRAVAFVEPAEGATPDPAVLRDWCAASLARFKVPESVHVIPEMPTTVGTNGSKIRAAALRTLAEQLAAQEA